MILTAIISVTFTAFADPIIRFAGSADDTHEAAVEYFQIIMGGIGFTTVMMIVNAAQRGAGNTKIALRTNMVSNLVNVVFNYLLIGGNFGFPGARHARRGACDRHRLCARLRDELAFHVREVLVCVYPRCERLFYLEV